MYKGCQGNISVERFKLRDLIKAFDVLS